ncbi:hypothetical protein THER_0199 [Thermodesulfovibrio sp. N1]|nr:hypothetical protein THER_0199 [Thermodesulfovibrio sp. N1]
MELKNAKTKKPNKGNDIINRNFAFMFKLSKIFIVLKEYISQTLFLY